MDTVWTVSALTAEIKNFLEASFDRLWIEGEISNLRRPPSGHLYFTLKDDKSAIRAVLFAPPYARRPFGLPAPAFDLEEGQSVLCLARLTVYPPRGDYQLIVERVEPKGLGALQKAFEQLKAKLAAEGLFAEERKRPLPFLPRRIGVITSPSGAVIRDILTILRRRFPAVPVLIAPVRVQGDEAPGEIVSTLRALNTLEDMDVILLARGGGSLEDLQAFNTEAVARAVAASRIPVVSAVGHETDVTIADFVADLRAPTPSAAAELVVPVRSHLAERVDDLDLRLRRVLARMPEALQTRLSGLAGRLRDPRRILERHRLDLDDALERLTRSLGRSLSAQRQSLERLDGRLQAAGPSATAERYQTRLAHQRKALTILARTVYERRCDRLQALASTLTALSPLAVLGRGYSITALHPEGRTVRSIAELTPGKTVAVRLADGSFRAGVTDLTVEE